MRDHLVQAFRVQRHLADGQRAAQLEQPADADHASVARRLAQEVDRQAGGDRQRDDADPAEDRDIQRDVGGGHQHRPGHRSAGTQFRRRDRMADGRPALVDIEPPGYKDGHKGEWIMTPDRLEKAIRLWWNTDYTIHIHCNGSGGLKAILDVLEKLQKEMPKKDHRLTIEHFGQSSAAQAKRIADLGAIVSANPYYLYSMGDKYAAGNLGEQRASEMVRLGSLLKNKVPFALHSDFTMAPIQPLLLAWIAVNRITADGTVMAAQERIPVYNALQSITSNAAFILRMENVTGSITTGKKADFVILAENPMKIEPIKLKDIKILETVFEGKSFPVNN